MVYFFIGVKGNGMRALVKFLVEAGNTVEGYDDNKNKACPELKELGVKIYDELSEEILSGKHIIVTAAMSIDDLKEKFNIDNMQYYNEFVSNLTKNIPTISVSGSFGKTTTTYFLSQILDSIKGCSYIIGDGTGHYSKKNETLVLESCEFNRHFLGYSPKDLIITNIGLEHLDCYTDFDDILKTFIQFCNSCNGTKVIFGDIENIDYTRFAGNILFYGFNEKNDVIIKNIITSEKETEIAINYTGKNISIKFPLMLGKHQVLDLVAAVIMANQKGCSIDKITSVISNLSLPKNRFVKKVINDIPVISDVAAHYEGIKNTLAQIKSMYPTRKLYVIFEPISYVRVKKTCDLLCSALETADFVYICDIFPLRENNPEQYNFSSHDLISKLKNATYYDSNSKLFFDANSIVAVLVHMNLEIIEKNINKLT